MKRDLEWNQRRKESFFFIIIIIYFIVFLYFRHSTSSYSMLFQQTKSNLQQLYCTQSFHVHSSDLINGLHLEGIQLTWPTISQFNTRPTLSQLWSFKIRPTTFLNYIILADLLISRILICERFGRGPPIHSTVFSNMIGIDRFLGFYSCERAGRVVQTYFSPAR